MNIIDIIKEKRDQKELSTEEINFFVNEYSRGNVPDYQASSLLMAIYLNGMSEKEILDLTMAMAHSGEMIDLSEIPGIKTFCSSETILAKLILVRSASSVSPPASSINSKSLVPYLVFIRPG